MWIKLWKELLRHVDLLEPFQNRTRKVHLLKEKKMLLSLFTHIVDELEPL